MSKIIIGSARIDEKGNISGGAAGDQNGKEVAIQTFYIHKKGWNICRAKSAAHATKLAMAMLTYCKDDNVGYDQSNRLDILKYKGTGKTECDCSSLVRKCIIDATGKDIGNFTTASEKKVLIESGLFDFIGKYEEGKSELLTGDILVSCTKGHTAIVTSAEVRVDNIYSYHKGCTYFTTCNLYCRVKPDKESKAVKIYPSGYKITVKDITVIDGNIWVKTCDGWSAAVYNKKVRVK